MALTRREISRKFEGSVLGWPWPFIQPLLSLGVYYFVFMKVLKLGVKKEFAMALFPEDPGLTQPYQVLLICCGLLPWHMTAEFTSRSMGLILANRSLVKKVYFPAELLPLPPLFAQIITTSAVFCLMMVFMYAMTPFGSILLWMLPLVLLTHALFLLGIAYVLSTITVFIRDVEQIVPLLLHLAFFLTPIVYVREVLGGGNRGLTWIFDVNPMAYCVELYRWAVVTPSDKRFTIGKSINDIVHLSFGDVMGNYAIFAGFALASFTVGYRIFMSQKHKFADEI